MKILSVKNENFPYKNISQITLKKLEMIKKNIHTIFGNQQPQQGQNQQSKQEQFFVQQGQNQPQSFQNLIQYQPYGGKNQQEGAQYQSEEEQNNQAQNKEENPDKAKDESQETNDTTNNEQTTNSEKNQKIAHLSPFTRTIVDIHDLDNIINKSKITVYAVVII